MSKKTKRSLGTVNAYKAGIIKTGRRVVNRGRIYFEREIISKSGRPVIQRVRVY